VTAGHRVDLDPEARGSRTSDGSSGGHDGAEHGGHVRRYAQDSDGNLWYFGEDTTEYENEKPKTKEGSWEAGVDGALPGVIMPASRQVGMTYREEHYKGHTEDGASIISTDALARSRPDGSSMASRRGTSATSSPM
jgi:hypothetical protein